VKGKKLISIIKNKYLITFLAFFVWLIVFDQHNLIDRFKTRKYLHKIIQDTTHYHDNIIRDQEIIDQLETNTDNLEKFAREKYMMKADNEDIFIIIKK